jgi:hypothetical protein
MPGRVEASTLPPLSGTIGPWGYDDAAAFNEGLWTLAKRRRHPPCATPEVSHYWSSTAAPDKSVARRGCNRCPLVKLCTLAGAAGLEQVTLPDDLNPSLRWMG